MSSTLPALLPREILFCPDNSASLAPGQSLLIHCDTLRQCSVLQWEIVLTSNAASSPDTIKVVGAELAKPVLTSVGSFRFVWECQNRAIEDTTVIITNNGNDTLKITVLQPAPPTLARNRQGTAFPRPIIFRHATFFPVVVGPVHAIDSHREQLGHVSGHGDGRRSGQSLAGVENLAKRG